MKNWKYIDGAKNGNSLSDKLKTIGRDKIVLTSPNGGKIILHKDGDAFVSEKGEIQTILEKNPSFETALEKYKSKGYKIGNEKTGAEGFFKQLSDDVKEREKKDDEDIEKVGNFKTGKSALKPGDRVQSYGVQGTVRKVEGEDSDNIYGEPIIEVEWDNGTVKKVGEHYLRKIGNKVGNRVIEKESEMSQELKNLLKKAPEWIKEKIQYAFSHGFTIDEKDFINAIKKEVGNFKTENGLARARNAMARNASSITYDDFLRKLENAINQSRDSVSFQMYGISDETVEAWVQKAKKEGYSQYIRDVRGAEVNLND